ncbi:hypothetical protein SAMN05421858_3031 [Haladaptatus litoreus]|uniref:DUF7344 domain-containing protein n=1 Tax=Haladaptatus litoreus TaxID=553468 RepID=A0A1N7CIQ9_9EURY|nr:hypothetical protein [Haladaptatus litoreus]SIR63472.1 hypothetical protein SAMN05421858_3031 [Haladaptatus litoreus]
MAENEPPPDEWENDSSQSAGESAAERDLDIDVSEVVLELQPVFEAIAHPRRRYLVYTLAEETEWSLDDLATKLAAWETDTAEANIATLTRQEMYTSLYHSHVPKLVDLDVIEFDDSTETITPGPHTVQVLAALEGAGGSLDNRQETHARSEFDREDTR